MITEQRLSELEVLGSCSQAELIRLARLGIWAERHGIETLKMYKTQGDFYSYKTEAVVPDYGEAAHEALAQLPKQGEE